MTVRKANDPIEVRIGEIHLHIHADQAATSDPRIAEILAAIKALTKGATDMATSLDDLTAKVEENTAVDQSAIALLEGLKAKLDEAGTDPEALAALSQQLGELSAALAAAVAANTPADPDAQPPLTEE